MAIQFVARNPVMIRGSDITRPVSDITKAAVISQARKAVEVISRRGRVTGTPVLVRFQPDTLKRLDELRGKHSRADYIRGLISGAIE